MTREGQESFYANLYSLHDSCTWAFVNEWLLWKSLRKLHAREADSHVFVCRCRRQNRERKRKVDDRWANPENVEQQAKSPFLVHWFTNFPLFLRFFAFFLVPKHGLTTANGTQTINVGREKFGYFSFLAHLPTHFSSSFLSLLESPDDNLCLCLFMYSLRFQLVGWVPPFCSPYHKSVAVSSHFFRRTLFSIRRLLPHFSTHIHTVLFLPVAIKRSRCSSFTLFFLLLRFNDTHNSHSLVRLSTKSTNVIVTSLWRQQLERSLVMENFSNLQSNDRSVARARAIQCVIRYRVWIYLECFLR